MKKLCYMSPVFNFLRTILDKSIYMCTIYQIKLMNVPFFGLLYFSYLVKKAYYFNYLIEKYLNI